MVVECQRQRTRIGNGGGEIDQLRLIERDEKRTHHHGDVGTRAGGVAGIADRVTMARPAHACVDRAVGCGAPHGFDDGEPVGFIEERSLSGRTDDKELMHATGPQMRDKRGQT